MADKKDDDTIQKRLMGLLQSIIWGPQAVPRTLEYYMIMLGFYRLMDTGTPINDRLIALPKAIEILATWEPSSYDARKLSRRLIDLLQDKRRGEPIGHDSKGSSTHSYPYVRKVEGAQSTADSTPKENLPDGKDIFGRLLSGDRTPHDNGISGMCHALATVIFLSLFRSSGGGLYYNGTSSFFDLSPLYGVNDADETIRINDGRGLLKPDSFFEDREVWLSPAVSVLLILFNRNHNYIARRLFAANEKGEWDPENKTRKQDNEIFRIARSINCIQFKNIIVEDFMKGLLGLSNVGPGVNIDFVALNQGQAYPQGDKLSVESILLYSWPALMSEADEHRLKLKEQYLRDHMNANSNRSTDRSKNPHEIVMFHLSEKKEYSEETLSRESDGYFDDGKLGRILTAATKMKAGTPGACSAPTHTKEIAFTFINKAREMNVCTLNEFRKSLRLKPFKTFEEWNPDGRIAQAARSLYGDINKLELYPGLQAEATMPGSGFRLGYTQTFGLLVDIVTCIRSDPRFTSDLTAKNLTSWGFKLCTSRPNNGAFGTMLSHLILRNLPRNYPYNNIYGLFPLTVPSKTEETLKKAEAIKKDHVEIMSYDFEEPKSTVTHVVTAEDEIKAVLNNPKAYATTYGSDLKLLTDGYGYMLGFDDESLHDADQDMMLYALMPDIRSYQEYATILEKTAHDLIKKKIDTKSKKQTIDIVRDVINPTCTRWVCQTICGLSFGPEGNEKDIDAWFEEFATLYTFIFRKFETVDGWAVRAEALAASKRLNKHIGGILKKIHNPPSDMGIFSYILRILKEFAGGRYLERLSVSRTFMERLSTTNETVGRFQRISKLEEFQKLMEHMKSEADKEKGIVEGKGEDTVAGKGKGKEKEKDTDEDKKGGTKGQGDGKGAVEDKGKGAKGSKSIIVTDEMEDTTKKRKEKLRDLRLIANVLGLSVVLSVNYAQACSQAIDFYLDTDRKGELDKILELILKDEPSDGGSSKSGSGSNNKSLAADNKHLIMGYIREAQRIGQPFGLHREVKEISKAGGTNPDPLERLGLKAGDHVFANFGAFHKTAASFRTAPPADGMGSGTVNPEAVNPRLAVQSIQGLGLHKCPGISLVNNTMPTMFETIFRLKGLRRKQGHQGRLQMFNSHIDSKDEDPRIFIDTEGRATPYPRSLVLEFDDYLEKPSKWETKEVSFWKKAADMFATFASLISSLGSLLKTFWWLFSSPASLVPVTVSTNGVVCNAPTTVFQRWDINTIVPGLDGQPSPIEYTLEHKKPHRLSVVDIDARDMQLAVYVDGIMRGLTTDFQLDKSNHCGEDVATCLSQNFSGGVVVVPPGRHNVKIIWAGKEYIPGTEDIDWGGEYSRRLKWQLEYCF